MTPSQQCNQQKPPSTSSWLPALALAPSVQVARSRLGLQLRCPTHVPDQLSVDTLHRIQPLRRCCLDDSNTRSNHALSRTVLHSKSQTFPGVSWVFPRPSTSPSQRRQRLAVRIAFSQLKSCPHVQAATTPRDHRTWMAQQPRNYSAGGIQHHSMQLFDCPSQGSARCYLHKS